VSAQVLHEFYVVATRKLVVPVAREIARAEVRQLTAWHPIATTLELREMAWSLEDRFSLSWWDAMIVAAAQESRCSALLTEDLQDGMEFDGVRVVNPFRSEAYLEELGLA
jgi:predicted nucleic acid-binding protein